MSTVRSIFVGGIPVVDAGAFPRPLKQRPAFGQVFLSFEEDGPSLFLPSQVGGFCVRLTGPEPLEVPKLCRPTGRQWMMLPGQFLAKPLGEPWRVRALEEAAPGALILGAEGWPILCVDPGPIQGSTVIHVDMQNENYRYPEGIVFDGWRLVYRDLEGEETEVCRFRAAAQQPT